MSKLTIGALALPVSLSSACASPTVSTARWYPERSCEGCAQALQLAIEHAKNDADVVKPLVVCPESEGWVTVFELRSPRVFEQSHCRAVHVGTDGRVENGDKEPICRYFEAKKECSPVRSRAK